MAGMLILGKRNNAIGYIVPSRFHTDTNPALKVYILSMSLGKLQGTDSTDNW